MFGIKSREGRWSVSLCSCSQDTAHFHYGNVVLHISLDDLRELGLAMQTIADDLDGAETHDDPQVKKGSFQ
jgi:hypothetical protein